MTITWDARGTFKSPTQPLCLNCGKKIAKATQSTWLGHKQSKPLTEVKASTNQQLVSWRFAKKYDYATDTTTISKTEVDKYSTWDGESYVDEFFCNGTCRTEWAYAMATAIKEHKQSKKVA